MAETFAERAQRNIGFVRFLVFVVVLFAEIVFFYLVVGRLFPGFVLVVAYRAQLALPVLVIMAFIAYLVARQVMKRSHTKDHVA